MKRLKTDKYSLMSREVNWWKFIPLLRQSVDTVVIVVYIIARYDDIFMKLPLAGTLISIFVALQIINRVCTSNSALVLVEFVAII